MTTNTVRGERALHSGSYPEFPGSTPGLATISLDSMNSFFEELSRTLGSYGDRIDSVNSFFEELSRTLGASNLDRAHDAERTR